MIYLKIEVLIPYFALKVDGLRDAHCVASRYMTVHFFAQMNNKVTELK